MPSNGSQHNAPLPLDLLALSDLSPPSPILSPSEVTSAWSWSDIQIELDLSIDGEDPPDLPRSTNAAGRGLCILPSLSISTVSSAGTFGPVCKRHRTGISSPMSPQNSVASSLSTLEDVHISHSVSSMDVSPSMPTSPLRSQRVLDPAPSHGTSGTASDEETTPTILASLSPSPDILSQMNHEDIPIDNENNIPTSLRMLSGISHMPPSYESLSLSPSDSCLMPSVRSNGRRVIDDALFGTDARRLALAATLATLEKKCHSEPSTPKLAALDSSHGLPVDLSAATVEILIDQEGFRGVLASFTYIGYSAQGSSIGSDGPSVAQFRPTRRQAFNFHYAALEPLPILRRITVNGEESRDYISRQASLGLKSNGVYFVRGHEILYFPTPGRGAVPTIKLQWRFEYLVDDRRTHTSGKLISDGEKVLTPLSFSCSPMLLHPLQGKKVRLMHVMKKSVIPKLVAEKMEPPNILPGKMEPQSDEARENLASPERCYNMDATRALNSHKRSATIWIPNVYIDEPAPIPPSINTTSDRKHVHPRRRRRASSAGQRSRPGGNLLSPHARLPHGNSPLCQNIISPSRLATLIDAEHSSNTHISPLPRPYMYVDTVFHPLSPSP